ncbi:MAG: prepilin-type N-terminal cleavage/methylation domain-containing protein [Candidatus Omnitrophica bacterium]|nr:prepilin-type N-terminal cleavage/methylation domain-containing protein [Candidatus Omnitrophota bacterium]
MYLRFKFYCLILSKRRSGFSLLELIIALVIIGILVASFVGFIYKASVIARQQVLQVELKSLRTALLLYKTIEGRYPDNLAVFIKARYKIYDREGIFGEEFLGGLTVDGKGYPADAFGSRFNYNQKTGEVYSSTPGYERW